MVALHQPMITRNLKHLPWLHEDVLLVPRTVPSVGTVPVERPPTRKKQTQINSEMVDSYRIILSDSYHLSFLYSNDYFLLSFDPRLFSGFF